MHSDSIVAPSIGSSEHFANAVSSNAKQSDGGTQFVKGKGKKPLRFHCDHCDRDGHSKERCWILHPQLRPNKDKGPDAKTAIQGNTIDFQSKLESLALQVQQLLQTHGSGPSGTESVNLAKTSGSISALSIKSRNRFIVDSGATDHMCSSPNILSNTISSSLYPPITVVNGVQVPTQGVGQLNVLSKKTEALLIPGLSSNLISVSKCAKQWNCNVIFTPQKVLFQDPNTKRMIGEGQLQNGLYTLDLHGEALVARKGNVDTSRLWH